MDRNTRQLMRNLQATRCAGLSSDDRLALFDILLEDADFSLRFDVYQKLGSFSKDLKDNINKTLIDYFRYQYDCYCRREHNMWLVAQHRKFHLCYSPASSYAFNVYTLCDNSYYERQYNSVSGIKTLKSLRILHICDIPEDTDFCVKCRVAYQEELARYGSRNPPTSA